MDVFSRIAGSSSGSDAQNYTARQQTKHRNQQCSSKSVATDQSASKVKSLKKSTPVASVGATKEECFYDGVESYPNTNVLNVDWALCAAKRVASVKRLSLQCADGSKQKPLTNFATLLFATLTNTPSNLTRADVRINVLPYFTLEHLIVLAFLPQQFEQYLLSIAQCNNDLHTAIVQCIAALRTHMQTLCENAGRDRDRLIKRMLFHADNGQTECLFVLDALTETCGKYDKWPTTIIKSAAEPDLFGRAVGALVHQVLQSASLRIFCSIAADNASCIILKLGWADALACIVAADKGNEDDCEKFNAAKQEDQQKFETSKKQPVAELFMNDDAGQQRFVAMPVWKNSDTILPPTNGKKPAVQHSIVAHDDENDVTLF